MSLCAMMRLLFSFVCTGYFALYAQNGLPEKACVIWDNSNIILPVHPPIPSDTKVIKFEGPRGNITKTVSLPSATLERDYVNGTLYAYGISRERDKKAKDIVSTTHILWRREADTWVIDATIDGPRMCIFPIIPLKNGNYLLVALRPFIEDESGAYLFGIFKKNKKNQLELDRPMTNVLSKPYWAKNETLPYGNLTQLGNPYVCKTNTNIIIHYQQVGWFFVFSPEDGRLIRKTKVFPEITEEAILAKKQFGPVGLGFEPRQDGRMVGATMSREYIVLAMDVFPTPTLSDMGIKPEDMDKSDSLMIQVEKLFEVEDKRIKKWPEIVWWDFDPDTGKFTKISTPDGFPKAINSREKMSDFKWRMRADGSLVMLDRDSNVLEPSKKSRKFLGLFELK